MMLFYLWTFYILTSNGFLTPVVRSMDNTKKTGLSRKQYAKRIERNQSGEEKRDPTFPLVETSAGISNANDQSPTSLSSF